MIDSHLMKDIMDEVRRAEVESLRAVSKLGVQIVPSDRVKRGKPVLLVHPDTFSLLAERDA